MWGRLHRIPNTTSSFFLGHHRSDRLSENVSVKLNRHARVSIYDIRGMKQASLAPANKGRLDETSECKRKSGMYRKQHHPVP